MLCAKLAVSASLSSCSCRSFLNSCFPISSWQELYPSVLMPNDSVLLKMWCPLCCPICVYRKVLSGAWLLILFISISCCCNSTNNTWQPMLRDKRRQEDTHLDTWHDQEGPQAAECWSDWTCQACWAWSWGVACWFGPQLGNTAWMMMWSRDTYNNKKVKSGLKSDYILAITCKMWA